MRKEIQDGGKKETEKREKNEKETEKKKNKKKKEKDTPPLPRTPNPSSSKPTLLSGSEEKETDREGGRGVILYYTRIQS